MRYGYPWDSRIGWLLYIGRPAERKWTRITPTRFLLVGGDNALYTDGWHICLSDTTQTGNWKACAYLSGNPLELICSYALFSIYIVKRWWSMSKHLVGGRRKRERKCGYVKEERRQKRDRGGIKGNKATRKELQTFPSKRTCMTNTNFPQP